MATRHLARTAQKVSRRTNEGVTTIEVEDGTKHLLIGEDGYGQRQLSKRFRIPLNYLWTWRWRWIFVEHLGRIPRHNGPASSQMLSALANLLCPWHGTFEESRPFGEGASSRGTGKRLVGNCFSEWIANRILAIAGIVPERDVHGIAVSSEAKQRLTSFKKELLLQV